MPHRLQLKRFSSSVVDYRFTSALRIRIEASDPDATGTDPAVFLYRRDPVNPYTSTHTDTFMTVCSPVDLAEYPVGAPSTASEYPFFRLHYVELDVRSTLYAKEIWLAIVREVQILLEAMERLAQLSLTETVNLGT